MVPAQPPRPVFALRSPVVILSGGSGFEVGNMLAATKTWLIRMV
jgi:hypothetical protein